MKSLKAQGVPLDGIGFEVCLLCFEYFITWRLKKNLKSHFILNELPQNISENMRQFNDLGVEVAVTELDIRKYSIPNSLERFG